MWLLAVDLTMSLFTGMLTIWLPPRVREKERVRERAWELLCLFNLISEVISSTSIGPTDQPGTMWEETSRCEYKEAGSVEPSWRLAAPERQQYSQHSDWTDPEIGSEWWCCHSAREGSGLIAVKWRSHCPVRVTEERSSCYCCSGSCCWGQRVKGQMAPDPEWSLSESTAASTLQECGQATVPLQASASSFVEWTVWLKPRFSVRLSMPPGDPRMCCQGKVWVYQAPPYKDSLEKKIKVCHWLQVIKRTKWAWKLPYCVMLQLPNIFPFECPDLRISEARALGWLSVTPTECKECAVMFHPVLG